MHSKLYVLVCSGDYDLILLLGAICYIELACVVPQSGGETVYLKAGFGDFVSFIFSWLRAVVLGPTR